METKTQPWYVLTSSWYYSARLNIKRIFKPCMGRRKYDRVPSVVHGPYAFSIVIYLVNYKLKCVPYSLIDLQWKPALLSQKKYGGFLWRMLQKSLLQLPQDNDQRFQPINWKVFSIDAFKNFSKNHSKEFSRIVSPGNL